VCVCVSVGSVTNRKEVPVGQRYREMTASVCKSNQGSITGVIQLRTLLKVAVCYDHEQPRSI